MSGPDLKPLEWQRRRLNSKFRFALDPFGGVYTLDGVNWTHDFASGWRSGGAEGAQADYETRIREVLVNSDDLPPTKAEALALPEVQALVDALRRLIHALEREHDNGKPPRRAAIVVTAMQNARAVIRALEDEQ